VAGVSPGDGGGGAIYTSNSPQSAGAAGAAGRITVRVPR